MTKCWVVKCPECGKYQAKGQENFGKKAQKCRCVYCMNEFVLRQNGRLVEESESTHLVQSLNGPEEYRGFGTLGGK